MKRLPLLISLISLSFLAVAQKEKITLLELPDSIRAVQFMAEINVQELKTHREVSLGIKTDLVSVALETGSASAVVFEFPATAKVIATGLETKSTEAGEIEWEYSWARNEDYRLLLSIASDSAENFTVYSGYIWIPFYSKWKLIGSCKITGRWGTIKQPALFYEAPSKKILRGIKLNHGQAWVQRSNGSWKNLQGQSTTVPVVNLTAHVDSIKQHKIDMAAIQQAITTGKTDAIKLKDEVYYVMMREGIGQQVSLTDTVVVYYKGYLLSDGSIFDQTKDKPATFPLNRLIRGWHIGVPLCKVGGKIKIVIPSALAYSVRTRAAKIPPNSILVFEVEVLETKPRL